MKKKCKGICSILLSTVMLVGLCPAAGTAEKVQAADVISAVSSNVEYQNQAEAIITANAKEEYVKVHLGATVEELIGDITETDAEIFVTNQKKEEKTNGTLTTNDRLVVKKGSTETVYDVIVMGDVSETAITAKKTDDYEFGMLGSNIGIIEDGTITLIDGKVRQLKYNDVNSKEQAREVNRSDYSGEIGRREALRNANEIVTQLESVNGTKQSYRIQTAAGLEKTDSKPVSGDKLVVTAEDGVTTKTYDIIVEQAAVSGKLELSKTKMTVGETAALVLDYYAGQRSPEATVEIDLPMAVKEENISVNLIGRGDVPFQDFGESSGELDENGYFENEQMHAVIGRFGSLWKYKTLGNASLVNGGRTMRFTMLDLRANNGVDLRITIENVRFDKKGDYSFSARYTTAGSDVDKTLSGLSSVGGSSEQAVLTVDNEIADLVRLPYNPELADPEYTYEDGGVVGLSYLDYSEMGELYTSAYLQWTPMEDAAEVELYQAVGTLEQGGTVKPGKWEKVASIENTGHFNVKNLIPDRYYQFKLVAKEGAALGESNIVEHYSGKLDASVFGVTVKGDGASNKNAVNKAVDWLTSIGGGTLLFKGNGDNDNPYTYKMGTIHLKDNVYLYVEKGARLAASARNDMDKPESAWFHYRDFNNEEKGAFANTENFLSKQDDGHSVFRNSMFFAMRAENIKIIGNGRLDGDKVIQKGDGTVNNNGCIDKMMVFKLCNNVEVGGINTQDDLKYDTEKASEFSKPDARPYYEKAGDDLSNMLYIDRNGHFAILSTATDHMNLHDTFVSRYSQEDYSRDAFDFMANREVYVTNIFSMQSSDDIVKLGSECSMGFTRPAWNYHIRNIIGDSYCNNFQLGSETADDIRDVYVDNLIVLGSNKAGFSISANDGALVKNVNLNSGKTGPVFDESGYFQKSNTSIFISVSHRGRVIGAEDYTTAEGKRAIRNVPIGHLDQVTLKNVKIVDAFSGSLYNSGGNGPTRYNPNKSKNETNDDEYTPVVVGYQMPKGVTAEDMPDGRNIGYITNVTLDNIDLTVKGYNQNGNYKFADTTRTCNELDVGQFNSRNMGVRPSYAFYVRHAKNVTFKNCRFDFEGTEGGTDDRYPVVFDDVKTATLDNVTMAKGNGVDALIQMRDADNISLFDCSYFEKSEDAQEISVTDAEGLGGGAEQESWAVYLKTTEHDYKEQFNEAIHWKECECGSKIDVAEHTYKVKSDEKNHWKECECGRKLESEVHSYQQKSDEKNHWKECGCGKRIEEAAHTDANEDHKCDSCGYSLHVTPPVPEEPEKPEEPVNLLPKDFEKDNPGLPKGTKEETKNSVFRTLTARVTKVTNTSQKLKWNQMKDADGYVVFAAMCNNGKKKYKFKAVEVIHKNTITSYTHKKLKKGTYYRYMVQAYKIVNGKTKIISTSKTIHSTTNGGKYGNISSLKLTGKTLKIKVNQKYKLKVKEVKKGKKSKRHRKLMFETSNTKIASVTEKGVIKGKKKGSCTIYVYAQNGVYTKMKVRVK